MAYADYKFYTESFGNVVPETDFPRLAERASDFVDLNDIRQAGWTDCQLISVHRNVLKRRSVHWLN